MAANAGLEAFLTIDTGVCGGAANACDVDFEEAVEHVACASRVIEGDHVRGVVEKNVGKVPGLLVDACRLALKGPVTPRGPGAGGDLEAFAAAPFHIVDEFFGANVVTDEIAVTREKEDGNLGENGREHGDGGFRVAGSEGATDRAGAFRPTGAFIVIDM